jgi:acyl carrier protein
LLALYWLTEFNGIRGFSGHVVTRSVRRFKREDNSPSSCRQYHLRRLATIPGYRQDARAASAAKMIAAQEIETKLLDFLKREVFAPEVVVTSETDLIASGFDSMSLVRVLLFLEQTYGFWIPEGEITGDALQTVHTLATTAARLLNAR